jgi:hypothetical protein
METMSEYKTYRCVSHELQSHIRSDMYQNCKAFLEVPYWSDIYLGLVGTNRHSRIILDCIFLALKNEDNE